MTKFIIAGRIKPYVRTTRKKKFVDPQWKQYEASRSSIRWQIKQQMNFQNLKSYPEKTPLSVSLTYVTRLVWNHDIDNVLKAILDACQTILYPDDRYIQHIGELKKIQTTRPHSYALFNIREYSAGKLSQDPELENYPDIVSLTYYNNP